MTAVGVPLMAPVVVSRDNPAGSDGDTATVKDQSKRDVINSILLYDKTCSKPLEQNLKTLVICGNIMMMLVELVPGGILSLDGLLSSSTSSMSCYKS